jgi:prevent-host-death family protein
MTLRTDLSGGTSISVSLVARSAILWHMSAPREVSQRDLRMRSKEIMDAVERGDSFTITRDGHQIGQLIPLRRRRRFVSRTEFAQGSQLAPMIDVATFRADQDSAYDQTLSDPYDR